jgi:hypothetical protein
MPRQRLAGLEAVQNSAIQYAQFTALVLEHLFDIKPAEPCEIGLADEFAVMPVWRFGLDQGRDAGPHRDP